MTITIQAGKYYRTRSGTRIGPLEKVPATNPNYGSENWFYPKTGLVWKPSGETVYPNSSCLDLVAELTDQMVKDTGGPAFPQKRMYRCSQGIDHEIHEQGMTLRQYAAIKLRVPDSGVDWLDDMIRQAKQDEIVIKNGTHR